MTKQRLTAKKKQVKRPLKKTEVEFIKQKVKGKSGTEAAMIATGTKSKDVAKTQAHRMLKNVNVQEELQKAFKRHGITLDKAIIPIADGLEATKTVIIGKDEDAFADQVPDHPTRLKASNMALGLMGFNTNNSGSGNTTNNFLKVSKDDLSEFTNAV